MSTMIISSRSNNKEHNYQEKHKCFFKGRMLYIRIMAINTVKLYDAYFNPLKWVYTGHVHWVNNIKFLETKALEGALVVQWGKIFHPGFDMFESP